ncbi:MAG TPA: ABC transporter permease, partial [Erysipelotrichaceae bacterium]|nr:ABC transporter permease [Erysipelotrichaceae bacterium]
MSKKVKENKHTNWLLTIVLILGTLTVFFPLYMALVIAFKKPSEMTNNVEGALGFPKELGFSNFSKAMEVTDFWNTLGNSL